MHTSQSEVDEFLFFLYSESPKNLLSNAGSRFFRFIIFISIIMLEKLEKFKIYQKNKIFYFLIEKTHFQSKIQIQHKILNK